MTSFTIHVPGLLQRLLSPQSLLQKSKVRRPIYLLQNAMLVGMYRRGELMNNPEGYLSGNVSSESKEKRLCSELQCPDADLLDASFAHGSVIENVAGESIIHLACY